MLSTLLLKKSFNLGNKEHFIQGTTHYMERS